MTAQAGKTNADTHYLYAKGHYQITNLRDDLRRINVERCSISLEYCRIGDVLLVLLEIAADRIRQSGNPENMFREFVLHLFPEGRWKIGAREDEDFTDVVLKNCLSVLRNTKVEGLQLGQADSSILPLSAG